MHQAVAECMDLRRGPPACAARRYRLQFGLRGLLLAVALTSAGMALLNAYVRAEYEQHQFLSAVAALGGCSFGDSEELLVSLQGPQITDDALARLARLPGRRYVTEIVIRRSAARGNVALSDQGLQQLTKFRRLKAISITHCPGITDAGIVKLEAVPSLQALYLFGCSGITDEGVAWLAREPGLKMLDLADTQVTPDSIRRLERALPCCQIVPTCR